MYLSYFKKFPEKNMTLEVVVYFIDMNEKTGTIIDTITHPLNYMAEDESIN